MPALVVKGVLSIETIPKETGAMIGKEIVMEVHQMTMIQMTMMMEMMTSPMETDTPSQGAAIFKPVLES